MLLPYVTIGNDFEVTHTEWNGESTTVHFELPDEVYGFKTLDCKIPSYELSGIYGFTQKEIDWCLDFCRRNAHLLIRYSKVGGIAKA